MEEGDDENINTLLCMGFPDVAEIKRALRLAKNDLNEAVAILTNEQPLSSYGTVDDLSLDVDMKYQVETFHPKKYLTNYMHGCIRVGKLERLDQKEEERVAWSSL